MQCRKLKTQDWFHRDGFPIAVERRDPQEPFGLHTHEFSELVIITGGHGLHITGEQSWPLAAGDVFVINGPRPHDYQSMEKLTLINILYQPRKLHLSLADLKALPGYHVLFRLEPAWRRQHQFKSRLHLSPPELAHVASWVDQLDEELRSRNPGFGFMATAIFMLVIGYLSRCYGRSRNPNTQSLWRIAETITHLETHFNEPISLAQLSRMARMSKRSFLRAFTSATDLTPISYLIQLRVNRAAEMLRRSNDSVTDIAFRVGFSDSNYFSRQFHKVLGMTPRKYRQQYHPQN